MKGIVVEIWGDYALFTRPEMKVERVSYDVITPSAARGILDAVYWHPGMRWIIDKIHVINPIEFTNIRRNEVKAKISARNVKSVMDGNDGDLYISTSSDIQQRASTLLKNVRYVIEAHFEMTEEAGERDSDDKFYAIAMRRFRKGQYYHQPCMGCREFPAYFRLIEDEKIAKSYYENCELDLGYMLYDMDFSDKDSINPVFFRARLRNGVINLQDSEVVR